MIATNLRVALLASVLSASLVACTSTAPTTTPDEGTPSASVTAEATSAPTSEPSVVATGTPTSAPTVAPSASSDAPRTYAFVVSFYSPGNGTDGAAFDKLTAIVAKLPKKVAQVSSRWGKEGEHDECFQLDELDAKAKADFIAQVTKDVGASNRVNIKENATCQGR